MGSLRGYIVSLRTRSELSEWWCCHHQHPVLSGSPARTSSQVILVEVILLEVILAEMANMPRNDTTRIVEPLGPFCCKDRFVENKTMFLIKKFIYSLLNLKIAINKV